MIVRPALSLPAIAPEVREGLTRSPKSLPPKLFYDAEGSALFEEITRLPEYYLTRTERAILEANAEAICRNAGENLSLVELGAGSADKTQVLIGALLRRQLRVLYAPLDISPAALQQAQKSLAMRFNGRLAVHPIVADIADLGLVRATPEPRLVLYIGSSLGNLNEDEAVSLLRRIRSVLGARDHLLLGTDLVKSPATLLPAYDDAAGITARFNKNILARINRELGGRFDLDAFRHVALWNAPRSRVEIYLESCREQTVWIDALRLAVPFAAGERLHTENSHKYTIPGVQSLLAATGFRSKCTWTDGRELYAVHLAGVSAI